MKKTFNLLLVSLGMTLPALSQPTEPFPLWPGPAPGAKGETDHDRPTLTPFFPSPEARSGAAIVVCPGGGYGGLAGHEGKDYALWFNEAGITAFVLKYRLGSHGYRHPVMLQDAARAVRYVRSRAPEWGIDPGRIGIIGSSAGGHLASTLATHFDQGRAEAADPIDRASSRPDLAILCYPVITLGKFTHQGSKNNLLGTNPPPDLVELLSNERQVTGQTPPCFVWHTVEDAAVPVENTLLFAEALRKAGVPFEAHVYEKGRHGIGLANGHPWTKDCLFWLKGRGFLK